MRIELHDRTADTAAIYFRMTRDPKIRRYLPQKAQSESEALADFRETQHPGASSYGRTIHVDGCYVGDVWCCHMVTKTCQVTRLTSERIQEHRGRLHRS